MAGDAQPQLPRGIDVWGVHLIIAAETSFRGDEVELRHNLDGERQRFRYAANVGTEATQNAANLAVLLALQHGSLGTEYGDAGRFNEHRLTGAAGTMHQP